jgi:hypothetical protein
MIKGYKIFFAWFLTVLFGSIGLPIWFEIIGVMFSDGNRLFHLDFSDFFLAVFACMLVSGLISLPTIITLLISNIILKKKNYSTKKHFKKINFIHFIMALITLFVIEGIMIFESFSYRNQFENGVQSYQVMPIFWFFIVMMWYVLCAVLCWFLVFKKVIRLNEDEKENLDSELELRRII